MSHLRPDPTQRRALDAQIGGNMTQRNAIQQIGVIFNQVNVSFFSRLGQ
jgi:hypothetical protein